jgi:hypothetical protein
MSPLTWRRWLERLIKQLGCTRRRSPRRPLLEALEDRVTPTTNIWTGLGFNSKWSTVNNWSLARVPNSSDDLVFNSTGLQKSNTDDIIGLSVKSITISGAGYTLGGSNPADAAGRAQRQRRGADRDHRPGPDPADVVEHPRRFAGRPDHFGPPDHAVADAFPGADADQVGRRAVDADGQQRRLRRRL